MPELHEVSYSREATIAAVRDFYQFLLKMYLPENMLEEPPAGGWPTITNERVHYLGKNDEVGELMRHLPYLSDNTLLAPHSEVAHWPNLFKDYPTEHQLSRGMGPVESYRIISEDLDWEHVPSSAFGILIGEDTMIIDTKFGVVHWVEGAPEEARDNPVRERIIGDFFDVTPENEHEWRCAPAWAIVDFFEVLKSFYRDLTFVPIHDNRVEHWFDSYKQDDWAPYMRCVRQVYKDHGWPDLSTYNKEECMKSIEKSIKESFPKADY
jgi:hypothetical protein